MDKWIAILLVLHFGYHLVATFGIIGALYHKKKVHHKGKWALTLSIIWLILSIILLTGEFLHHHSLHCGV